MTVKIGSVTFEKWNKLSVNLIYDCIASTFSMAVYFNPSNKTHRTIFQPGNFAEVTITHNNELLFTGTLLSCRFIDEASPNNMVHLSGYSKTGVLEDCEIPESIYPLQRNDLSFTELTKEIIAPFGLKLIVDDSVKEICDKPIPSINADSDQTVKSYLTKIATQLNVVISHTAKGELLFTGYKTKNPTTNSGETATNKAAVFNFKNGMPGIRFEQIFDGQKMHSEISVRGQAAMLTDNAAYAKPILNPYVGSHDVPVLVFKTNVQPFKQIVSSAYRPTMVNQTYGTDITVEKAQRNVLSAELKALPLRIEMRGWNLAGKIVRPGDIITVQNPYLHIYSPARFIIAGVDYVAPGPVREICNLHCVVVEAFNNDTPKNIFL